MRSRCFIKEQGKDVGLSSRSMNRQIFILPCVTIVTILYVGLSPVRAQEVAVGTVSARVLANITVTANAALDFGDIFQGVPTSITNNNANAAIFTIVGESGAGIAIFMQLPEYVSLSDGSDRMPIIFGATDASIDTTGAGDPAAMGAGLGWQNVNPYNLPAAAIIGSSGTNIYLGGKVTPSVNQKAGNYSNDIIVTVSYNGL
jgi:hypothetical protein